MPLTLEICKSKLIPARAGIGLRAEHYQEILERQPDIGWFEVHSENYFGDGGRPLYYLEKLSEFYPVSLHGVGLSIGSTDDIDTKHLEKLKNLIKHFKPGLVSEHLSWGSFQGRHFNDLFPMPYTEEALEHMIDRVLRVQDYLARQILVENVSSYLQFECSTIPEWEFLAELATRSGCGILLDVNNVYVNARNHNFDSENYLRTIPIESVKEIHLAGHTAKQIEGRTLLIDTHKKRVTDEVWMLFEKAARLFENVPVLLEWDTDIPALDILLDEAAKADNILHAIKSDRNHEHIA